MKRSRLEVATKFFTSPVLPYERENDPRTELNSSFGFSFSLASFINFFFWYITPHTYAWKEGEQMWKGEWERESKWWSFALWHFHMFFIYFSLLKRRKNRAPKNAGLLFAFSLRFFFFFWTTKILSFLRQRLLSFELFLHIKKNSQNFWNFRQLFPISAQRDEIKARTLQIYSCRSL